MKSDEDRVRTYPVDDGTHTKADALPNLGEVPTHVRFCGSRLQLIFRRLLPVLFLNNDPGIKRLLNKPSHNFQDSEQPQRINRHDFFPLSKVQVY